MKIKSDFVTNSSSASFIVKSGLTQIDVAEKISEIIFEETNDDQFVDSKWIELRRKNKIKVFKCLEKLRLESYDGNIAIPFSIQEITYIYSEPFKFRVRVDTCNNYNWYDKDFDLEYYVDEDQMYDHNPHELFLDVSDGEIKTREKVEEDKYSYIRKAMEENKNKNESQN